MQFPKSVKIDTETSDLTPGDDAGEILEIAVVISQGKECYNWKVKPRHIETASPRALEVNGYTPEKWADAGAEDIAIVLPRVLALLKGQVVVGQNIAFDMAFLEYACRTCGLDPREVLPDHRHRVDLVSLAFLVLTPAGLPKRSLEEVCEFLGVHNRAQHTAWGDAIALAECCDMLAQRTEAHGC